MKSHLLPSHRENSFQYLLGQDESSSENNIFAEGIVDFNESAHKNKKAYSVTFTKDSDSSNDHRSRIGINIYPLDVGSYTIIMEYYWPENTNIQLSCQATTAWVRKQTSKDFSSYTKLLVQFNQTSKDTPDYLFFNIHGRATVNNPQGYLIFYGLKEWVDSVPPRIYDTTLEESFFELENGKMNMDINLNGNSINAKFPFCITGVCRKSKSARRVLFDDYILNKSIPFDCTLDEIVCGIYNSESYDDRNLLHINLRSSRSIRTFDSTSNSNVQVCSNVSWNLNKNSYLLVRLSKLNSGPDGADPDFDLATFDLKFTTR